MRPGAFVPMRWRLPECMRLILPFAVILKRLRAPRWVFNFNFGFVEFLGMTEMLSLIGGVLPPVQFHEFGYRPGRSKLRHYKFKNKFKNLLRLLGVGRRLAAGLCYCGAFFRR